MNRASKGSHNLNFLSQSSASNEGNKFWVVVYTNFEGWNNDGEDLRGILAVVTLALIGQFQVDTSGRFFVYQKLTKLGCA